MYSYLLWFSWIRDQQESEGVTPGEDVYIILRLDGRVRRSGIVIILRSQFHFGTRKFITCICNRSTEVGQYNSIAEPYKEGLNDIESIFHNSGNNNN